MYATHVDPAAASHEASLERLIDAGRVVCPVRGVVDIELCFRCPGFTGLHEGTVERLVCDPERDPTMAARRLLTELGIDAADR